MDAKKAMILTGVGLALFLVLFRTDDAVAAVNSVLGALQDGAEAIINFTADMFGPGGG